METKKFLSKENLSLLWGRLKSWVESKFSSFESKHFANSNVKVNVTVPADAVFTDTNTQYSAGNGIHLKGTQIINTGVSSISAGSSSGILNVIRSDTTGQSYSVPVTVPGLSDIIKSVGSSVSDSASSGYQIFSTGLRVAWIKTKSLSGLASDQEVTLPCAFHGTNYAVACTVASSGDAVYGTQHVPTITNRTTTSFKIGTNNHPASSANTDYTFIIVGY